MSTKTVEKTMSDHVIPRAEAERVVAAVAEVERRRASRARPVRPEETSDDLPNVPPW